MNIKAYILKTKVFKLFLVFSVVSTIIVLSVYYLSNNRYKLPFFGSIFPNTSSEVVYLSELKPKTSINIGNGLLSRVNRINQSEHRSRVIRDKIKRLTNQILKSDESIKLFRNNRSNETKNYRNIHIFYSYPVNWYQTSQSGSNEPTIQTIEYMRQSLLLQYTQLQPNIVFYPLHGLYKIENKILQSHMENVRLLGAAVLSKYQ